MSTVAEKGGGTFQGIKLLLCENPLPPIDEAIATLQHEDQIRVRAAHLRAWTEELAGELRTLDMRTYPTQTYFFLADFAPHNAAGIADRLRSHNILVKPLNDPALGPGYMRITSALPEDNRRFIGALRELLSRA